MERSAFEQKARTWREKALNVSRHYGAGEDMAEDIAQDVMLRLWQMHDELEAKENEEWLIMKLQQLPTTQRTLLYMRQEERRSHEEIAQLLGIETTSVSTLLARARHTHRWLMQQKDCKRLKSRSHNVGKNSQRHDYCLSAISLWNKKTVPSYILTNKQSI